MSSWSAFFPASSRRRGGGRLDFPAAGFYAEQFHLVSASGGNGKQAKIQVRARLVQTQPAAGGLEPCSHQLGDRPLAGLSKAPVCRVIGAAARLADQRHDLVGSKGLVCGQPLLEQAADFPGQADQHIASTAGAGLGRGFENPFQFMVIQAWNHRGEHHDRWHAGRAEGADGLDPATRSGRPGFHAAGQFPVEGGDRDRDPCQALCGGWREDIEIPKDQGGLGDQGEGMAKPVKGLDHLPGNPQRFLYGLVGIGIAADMDDLRAVAFLRQLPGQQFMGEGFEEQPALEIQTRRQAQIGVSRPSITIDAAVLAAPIGIDRLVKGNIGAVVAGDYGPGHVRLDHGSQRLRRLVVAGPAIVERLLLTAQKPACGIGSGAAALGLDGDR